MPKPKLHIIIILLLIPLALSSCLDKKFNPGILDEESVTIESDVTYDTDSLYIDLNIINNEDFDIVYPAFEIYIVDRRISFFDFFTMLDNAFVFEFARCDLDIEHTHTSSICYHFEEIPRLCNIKPKDTLHLRVSLPRNMPDDIEDYQKRKKIINILRKNSVNNLN